MFRAVAAGVLLVVAGPAIGQATTETTVVTETSEKDGDKIVCKKEEKLGSRLGAKRLCLKVSEWDERAQENRQHTETLQQQSGFRKGN